MSCPYSGLGVRIGNRLGAGLPCGSAQICQNLRLSADRQIIPDNKNGRINQGVADPRSIQGP